MPTDDDAEATRDDRAMLLHEDWWPRQSPYPHLCLKHRTITITGHPHGLPRTAILVWKTVDNNFSGFLVMPYKDDNPLELEEGTFYASADAVLAAGWEVD